MHVDHNEKLDPKPASVYSRAYRIALDAFGVLWALPLSLFGVLLLVPAWIFGGRIYVIPASPPALLVRGPLSDYLLAHHPLGAMSAMAIGHVVLAGQYGLSHQILTHEIEHVRQAARWGILFPFAYIAASLWAWITGRDLYWHNVFEVAAREAEKLP